MKTPTDLPATDRLEAPFAVTFRHQLLFTSDVLGEGEESRALTDLLEPSEGRQARVLFVVDDRVASARPDLVARLDALAASRPDRFAPAAPARVVPGGEAIKNHPHHLEEMLRALNDCGLDRRGYVVVIGGGAVLDAVGFAAAVAHRGIRLIRLPTTTLAQADSGVGVKNAVNFFGKKNWLGSFAVPWAVINDAALLETLPNRDFIAGFSEAVKVTLLKSPSGFDRLCREARDIRRREPVATRAAIRESVRMHLDHITRGGDPFEALEARPLDFGHWSAHRLEPLSQFAIRHGEAVAIGVAIDTVYSSLALGLPGADAERVLCCLSDLGFTLSDPLLGDPDALFDGLEEFRQHLGGRLTLTMLRAVGDPVDVHEVDRDRMRQAIDHVARWIPPSRPA
ncbi:3-dehydroquinate synthase [Tundrisphaera sp. TA3]|uniref:3-dehydroquinate synthase n=1 Tax=Tundrisphaera sp. TA3 TaxID=3435775 RepID=UPI003EBA21FD